MKQQQLNPNILRQGDVLCVRRGDAPEQKPAKKAVVLAEGEITGHRHQFMARSRAGVVDEGLLAVSETAWLQHEEHSRVIVPPGLYDLPAQVEHTDSDEPMQVAD
jgi:hypothetical protein